MLKYDLKGRRAERKGRGEGLAFNGRANKYKPETTATAAKQTI